MAHAHSHTTTDHRSFSARIGGWLALPPTDGPTWTLFLRLMAGSVFLWEGILKFVYANQGIGRFTKLGFPFPGVTADGVALLEIVGGLLILAGLFTRFIALAFIIEMLTAIFSTKISLYLGTSPLPLPPSPPKIGIWAVLHEVRSEWAQLMTSLFLLFAGPGRWSLDARLTSTTNARRGLRPTAGEAPVPMESAFPSPAGRDTSPIHKWR